MKTAFEKQNSVQYIPTVLQKTKVVVKHRNIIQVNEATYLCKLCIHYLKKGRLPPMAVKNKLELHHTDKYLKDNGLALTELEAALISKNIMFEKIFQLPKSRWTALKDRIINVPISDSSILDTIQRMPRLPKEAGLIGVCLKRKRKMKNFHKQELINPIKLFHMLDKLSSCNKYYKFCDDINVYKNRCKNDDKYAYDSLFDYDDVNECFNKINADEDVNDQFQSKDSSADISDDDEISNEEVEEVKLNPVRKYQYVYDKSLCMSQKYPEIMVAPGEGQIPIDTLQDEDWDIKSFPHLHNFDGSNGLFEKRKSKLTDQYYFIQRICNKEKRFFKCSAYVYAAIAHLEKKQIQSNINLCGTRGKQIVSPTGAVKYELKDAYNSLENVSNTPKFWQKKKYELLAKIDNLGPFHIFFTLSCADLRWDANFAAILLDKGYHILYTVLDDDIIIEARTEQGDWQSIDDIIKNEMDETHHELIRGNVITATRYFQHRVKSFFSKIVLNKNNPMCVKNYSYRVEFQERGAAHIHGTLWLNLTKLEDFVSFHDDQTHRTVYDKSRDPQLMGIKSAFNKLKLRTHLDEIDKKRLTSVIDNFSTVSLHTGSVGEDVVNIASSVNKHHHTKTCRKYSGDCRFDYPKPPSPFTIVAQQSEESKNQKIMAEYRNIINLVQNVTDDRSQIDTIMRLYDKESETIDEYNENKIKRIKAVCNLAGVDYTKYLKALSTIKYGYKIILSRDIDETYINPYNVEWLRAWDGNMDIQFVLDYFAVVTYVTEYYLKPDSGTMVILNDALRQCESTNIREQMKAVANKFLSHRN